MHEYVVIGTILAYPVGRTVQVEARGRCALVSTWMISRCSSEAELPIRNRRDRGSIPFTGSIKYRA